MGNTHVYFACEAKLMPRQADVHGGNYPEPNTLTVAVLPVLEVMLLPVTSLK